MSHRHCEERSDEAIPVALSQALHKVPPIRIRRTNQRQLLSARAALDLLLARNRVVGGVEEFVVDESINLVVRRKQTRLDALPDIGRYRSLLRRTVPTRPRSTGCRRR